MQQQQQYGRYEQQQQQHGRYEQQQQQYGRYEQVNHYGRPTARRRKSLLIGINYEGQSQALQGCRQDVRNMVS